MEEWKDISFTVYTDVLEKACFQFIHEANANAVPTVCRLIRARVREINRESLTILVGHVSNDVYGLDGG